MSGSKYNDIIVEVNDGIGMIKVLYAIPMGLIAFNHFYSSIARRP